MGVYIKGMEMPKDYSVVVKIFPDGRVGMVHYIQYFKADLIEGAQAVPVPPHGDLIERLDVIGYCSIPQGCEDTFDSGVMWLAERIDELPTVIPASEEE